MISQQVATTHLLAYTCSNLYKSGIQVLPESSFDGQNITILCEDFNRLASSVNVTRGDNPIDNPTAQPQISNGTQTEIDQTTIQDCFMNPNPFLTLI